MLNLLLPPPLALGTKAMEAALRLGPSATEGQFQARRRRQRLPLPLLASRLAPWPPSSAHRPATLRMHLPLPSRLRCTVGARPDAQGGRALAPPVDGALEALFKQLEEDLENDDLSVDDDDDGISEEDMARFEKELAEAIEDVNGVDESAGDPLLSSGDYGIDEQIDGSEQPELKTWQLRRLARALKIGRRKTSIKNLAGELGLDRGLVIEMLRNPPPKLLLMSDSLPDEAPSKSEVKEIEPPSSTTVDEVDTTEIKPQLELPVHVMSAEWSARKRLKKVQFETLERVYLRSKRPTNAMISSIVQVTNLPRKTIVKWFEDRREQDGVPDHRVAFKRSQSEIGASS